MSKYRLVRKKDGLKTLNGESVIAHFNTKFLSINGNPSNSGHDVMLINDTWYWSRDNHIMHKAHLEINYLWQDYKRCIQEESILLLTRVTELRYILPADVINVIKKIGILGFY